MTKFKKTYSRYMDEITPDELYEGFLGYGLFAEQLPSIFTSEPFMLYMKENYSDSIVLNNQNNKNSPLYTEWIDVDILRNTAVPRTLSIPNPFSYHNLCCELKKVWPELQKVFRENTKNWKQNKVIKVHIRKQKGTKSLFKLSYNNWRKDGDSNANLNWLIGSKYIVQADMSSCFPSIYTHSLPWAIMGKDIAKREHQKRKREKDTNNEKIHQEYECWNKLDAFTRYIKNNETHGLLIGPHASNVLSEIIFTKIDSALVSWKYERAIDDYTCYVATLDQAEAFLSDLTKQLRVYGLNLNHKKTKIKVLPTGNLDTKHDKLKISEIAILPDREYEKITKDTDNNRGRKGKRIEYQLKKRNLDYQQVKGYLSQAIQLACTEQTDISLVNYAIKLLGNSEQFELSKSAKKYFYIMSLSLASLYPYLLKILDKSVMPMRPKDAIYKTKLVKKILNHAKDANQFEECYYAIYFDIKYKLNIIEFLSKTNNSHQTPKEILHEYSNWIIESNDCLLKLFGWLWVKHYQCDELVVKFQEEAERLARIGDWDKNWLFNYECLDEEKLDELRGIQPQLYKVADAWWKLKKNKISFLIDEW